MRIIIADETGWTLDYIDSLSLDDVADWLAVRRGRSLANNKH